MRATFALTLLVMLGALGATARADDAALPPTYHKGQFGASVRVGVGLRGIATYDPSVYCGVTDSNAKYGYAPVCTGRSPVTLGLEASYGVTAKIELLAELDLGLERDFAATPAQSDGPRALVLAPGARFFFSETGRVRTFVTAQAVLDFTDYHTASGAGRGADFGVRSLQGVWVDLHRSYGFYVYAGETATFSRWLDAQLEAGIGFQARYP